MNLEHVLAIGLKQLLQIDVIVRVRAFEAAVERVALTLAQGARVKTLRLRASVFFSSPAHRFQIPPVKENDTFFLRLIAARSMASRPYAALNSFTQPPVLKIRQIPEIDRV